MEWSDGAIMSLGTIVIDCASADCVVVSSSTSSSTASLACATDDGNDDDDDDDYLCNNTRIIYNRRNIICVLCERSFRTDVRLPRIHTQHA